MEPNQCGQSSNRLETPSGTPDYFYLNMNERKPDYLVSGTHLGAGEARALPVRRQAVLACRPV